MSILTVRKSTALDVLREYVSAGQNLGVLSLKEALPQYIDDATRDFGDDLYERMSRDPVISANLHTLVGHALENGIMWEPAVAAPAPGEESDQATQARYDRAAEIRDALEEELERMDTDLCELVEEMLLSALAMGNKVAELLWETEGAHLRLVGIRTKPRATTAYVVDRFMNVLGLTPTAVMDQIGMPLEAFLGDGFIGPIVPREKFLIMSHRPKNGDIRGTSILRSCYNAWYVKQQIWPDYLKFLVQFGSPSLVGFTSPEASPEIELDANGEPVEDSAGNVVEVTPEEAMHGCLAEFFKGGTVAVFPNGADVKPIFSGTNGEAFEKGFTILNKEITLGMLWQLRATMEAEHGSRADSQTGQDILAVAVAAVRKVAKRALYQDLARTWVRYNYPDALDLVPVPRLQAAASEDFAANAVAVGTLYDRGFIADDQIPFYDAKLGAPPRDMEAWKAKQASAADESRMALAEQARLMDQGGAG